MESLFNKVIGLIKISLKVQAIFTKYFVQRNRRCVMQALFIMHYFEMRIKVFSAHIL